MSKISDDIFINSLFSVGNLVSLISIIGSSVLWDKYGFINCYYLSILSRVIMLLIIIFVGGNRLFFGIFSIMLRGVAPVDRIFSYFSLVDSHGKEATVKLVLLLNTQYIVGFIIAIFLNKFLVFGTNYDYVAWFYLIANGIAFILIPIMKKVFDKERNK